MGLEWAQMKKVDLKKGQKIINDKPWMLPCKQIKATKQQKNYFQLKETECAVCSSSTFQRQEMGMVYD